MKRAARLLALGGALALGLYLFRGSPRDVVLVYDLGGAPGAAALEVAVLRADGKLARRARFEAPAAQVRHAVQLVDGAYRVRFRVERPGGALEGERPLEVRGGGTVVLALGP